MFDKFFIPHWEDSMPIASISSGSVDCKSERNFVFYFDNIFLSNIQLIKPAACPRCLQHLPWQSTQQKWCRSTQGLSRTWWQHKCYSWHRMWCHLKLVSISDDLLGTYRYHREQGDCCIYYLSDLSSVGWWNWLTCPLQLVDWECLQLWAPDQGVSTFEPEQCSMNISFWSDHGWFPPPPAPSTTTTTTYHEAGKNPAWGQRVPRHLHHHWVQICPAIKIF